MKLAHALLTEYSGESLMAGRTGQDSTMLHYLGVQQAMVSKHRPKYLIANLAN